MRLFTDFYMKADCGITAEIMRHTVKSRCVNHRAGSGLVCLTNSGCDCNPARYRIFAKANVGIPTGGTVGPISLRLSLNGEVLQSSIATVTPAAVGEFFNVAFEEIVCAGKCQVNVAVTNPTDQTIEVENLVLIVERVC